MIYRLAIENFFSIADKQELLLPVSQNVPNRPCFIHSGTDKSIRLPAAIGIFGPNASGKSTIFRALVSTALFIIDSFNWQTGNSAYFFQPYRQKEWAKKPSIIVFEFDGQLEPNEAKSRFKYELHISHDTNLPFNKIITYEALSYAPQKKFRLLFKRENQKFHFGKDFDISKNDPRKESIRSDTSVISTLAQFNHKPSIYLRQLLSLYKTNSIGFDRTPPKLNQLLTTYSQDKNCLGYLNKELRRFDVGLESMTIEKTEQRLIAKFQHAGLDDFIFFEEESSGTKRFIEIFIRLYYALETGSLAIIDEIDSDLHPLLLPEILRWFSDPNRNPHGAQLFFTAHNPALLDELEKEQVFFTEKTCGKSTNLYAAKDIQGLRREPSLMKKYLAGELGAVPHIG